MIQKDPALPDNLRCCDLATLKIRKVLKENLSEHACSNPGSFFRVLILCRPQFAPILTLDPALEGLCFESRNDFILEGSKD